jgi:hypothetical protein
MGAELGMNERLMGAQAWDHTRFLEHIKPRWRSEQVSIWYNLIERQVTFFQLTAVNCKLQEIIDMHASSQAQ